MTYVVLAGFVAGLLVALALTTGGLYFLRFCLEKIGVLRE
jgi:hypothetical protein